MPRRKRSGHAHPRFLRLLKGTAERPSAQKEGTGNQPAKTEEEILQSILDYAVRLEWQPDTTKLSMSLVLLVVCAKRGFPDEDLLVFLSWLDRILWHSMCWEGTLLEQEVFFGGDFSPERTERLGILLGLVDEDSTNPELFAIVRCVALSHVMENEYVLLEVLRHYGNLCPEETWTEVVQMLPTLKDRLHYLVDVLRIPPNLTVGEDWE